MIRRGELREEYPQDKRINVVNKMYEIYRDILIDQCSTSEEMIPPESFFFTEQMEEKRICDIQKLCDIQDKKSFLINSFWELLGTAPGDQMLEDAEKYPSSIQNYQRDLIYSILNSDQFNQNDIIGINNPFEGKSTVKQRIRKWIYPLYKKFPSTLKEKVRKVYRMGR